MRTAALALVALALVPPPAWAETPVAARTIRAHTVIEAADLTTTAADVPGALGDPALIVGRETRVALYAGRPIMPGDVGPPALVERNQIVRLTYDVAGLAIVTEGRSLGRAAAGETVRVMNLSSRTTVTGFVRSDGTVAVGLVAGS